MTHPITLAMEWLARGIPAFPVEIYEQDGRVQKRPLTKNGHRDASPDPEVVRDMFVQANPRFGGVLAVGLVPGAGGFVVLDPDVKDGQDGPGFADSLGIPPGWMIITASGGQHRWFRKPDPTIRYSNRTPEDWHGFIDIRADNGWVVAPGTATEWGTWAEVEPWPADGPPEAPRAVLEALTEAGAPGDPTEAHRAGAMTPERRDELPQHTLNVYDWMVETHGAHSPQILKRSDGDNYLSVCRPKKGSGISATIGFASPGALHVWSSNWPGLTPDETTYPLGRDPDLLGATAAVTGTVVTPSGAYFLRGALQVATVVKAVMEHRPVAVDLHGNFWIYAGGRWTLSKGADSIGESMYRLLGQQFRKGYVDTVAVGVRADAEVITPDAPNPKYVNVSNGMLDWATGELSGHAPEFHSVNQLPVLWDPSATCPGFDRWILEVLPPDLTAPNYDGVSFVDLLLGYLVIAGNPHQLALLLLGTGSNGKTLFINIIHTLLGPENYTSVPLKSLADNRFRAATVYGKLANICGDLDTGRLPATDVFKKITGGDLLDAEVKYGAAFTFTPYAVPLFSANAVFGTPDTSEGYFRRWLIVPFPHSFKGREDPTLKARLTVPGELSGILARAIRGARALATLGGFPNPPSVDDAREKFVLESDPVRAFLDECTERAPGHSETTKAVYDLYKVWAARAGRAEMNNYTLNSRIEGAGFRITKTHGFRRVRGLKIAVKVVYGELLPLVPAADADAPDDPLAGLVRPPAPASEESP